MPLEAKGLRLFVGVVEESGHGAVSRLPKVDGLSVQPQHLAQGVRATLVGQRCARRNVKAHQVPRGVSADAAQPDAHLGGGGADHGRRHARFKLIDAEWARWGRDQRREKPWGKQRVDAARGGALRGTHNAAFTRAWQQRCGCRGAVRLRTSKVGGAYVHKDQETRG